MSKVSFRGMLVNRLHMSNEHIKEDPESRLFYVSHSTRMSHILKLSKTMCFENFWTKGRNISVKHLAMAWWSALSIKRIGPLFVQLGHAIHYWSRIERIENVINPTGCIL